MRKPRLNMIIGKKQIIIAGLTLLLGMAVAANYTIATNKGIRPSDDSTAASKNSGKNESESKKLDGDESDANSGESGNGGNYGDAQFVLSGGVEGDDVSAFFAQARLSKRESRDEAKEFLETMISGGDVRGDEIQAIAFEAATLGNFIESESRIEAVLKAQGFSDALCYISEKGANVIVRAVGGLNEQSAAKIRDALLSEVDISADSITIVEVA